MLRIVINMIYTDVGMQGSIEGTDTVNRYSKKNGTDTVKMQFGWTEVSEKKMSRETKRDKKGCFGQLLGNGKWYDWEVMG